MKPRKIVLMATTWLIVVFTAAVIIYSCSSGGGTPSGMVATYVTDSMSDYKQVLATITEIDLLNSGSGNSCTIVNSPVTLDLTDLSEVMQLINVDSCPVGPYNRIHIKFAKDVGLMDLADNTSRCLFTSYKDDDHRPNALACGTDTCTLDINGAVNVLVDQQNKLALDFDLKNFDVTGFGDPPACSVTMKVSPLHATEMQARMHPEAVTGVISDLSTTDRTFTLTRGNTAFSVLYSGITTSEQPGLDTLLHRAQDDRLRTRALASQIDLALRAITASAIFVKVEGSIASGSLDTANHTFTLNYRSEKSISLDYSSAVVEGTLTEGSWVEAKLYGHDGMNFLARKVELEANGAASDD